MRPSTVVVFERLNLSAFAIGLIEQIVNWGAGLRFLQKSQIQNGPELGEGFMVFSLVGSLGLSILLTLLISRYKSQMAMWIWIVLFLFATMYGILHPIPFVSLEAGIAYWVQIAMQFIGIVVLFSPSARRWMKHEKSNAGPTRMTNRASMSPFHPLQTFVGPLP